MATVEDVEFDGDNDDDDEWIEEEEEEDDKVLLCMPCSDSSYSSEEDFSSDDDASVGPESSQSPFMRQISSMLAKNKVPDDDAGPGVVTTSSVGLTTTINSSMSTKTAIFLFPSTQPAGAAATTNGPIF